MFINANMKDFFAKKIEWLQSASICFRYTRIIGNYFSIKNAFWDRDNNHKLKLLISNNKLFKNKRGLFCETLRK